MKGIWLASNIYWNACIFDFQSCCNHHIILYSAFKHICTITLWQIIPLYLIASEFTVAWGKMHLHSRGKIYSQGVFPLQSTVSLTQLPICISFSEGVNISCKHTVVWITALDLEMFSWGLEFVLLETWIQTVLMRVVLAGPIQSTEQHRTLA